MLFPCGYGVAVYVQIVQDMYRSCKTQVVTQKGETEYFPIEVGLHQGSVKPVETFLENKRLKWFGHCLRRTQPHLCKIAATRDFWEKEQRLTEKEMEGQHTGRHEEIPTD